MRTNNMVNLNQKKQTKPRKKEKQNNNQMWKRRIYEQIDKDADRQNINLVTITLFFK